MNVSAYLKPAAGVVLFVALAGGWYWFENRSPPEQKDAPVQALVVVTKATNASQHALAHGLLGQGLDALDQGVTGVDIDTGIFVGQGGGSSRLGHGKVAWGRRRRRPR